MLRCREEGEGVNERCFNPFHGEGRDGSRGRDRRRIASDEMRDTDMNMFSINAHTIHA